MTDMLHVPPSPYCEHCGREIGWKRLAAVPNARFCVRCQERYDRRTTAVNCSSIANPDSYDADFLREVMGR